MAQPNPPPATVQLIAIFSRHTSALDWAIERISQQWGRVALLSARFDHSETTYYAGEMGSQLLKQFVVVDGLYDPAELPQSKLTSNAWENELSASHQSAENQFPESQFPEKRPLNIDPGYVTLTKLVLASCKDRAHRIYLRDGIYAEECLYYLGGAWQSRPWTYPDYQRPDFQAFFEEARDWLKALQRTSRGQTK